VERDAPLGRLRRRLATLWTVSRAHVGADRAGSDASQLGRDIGITPQTARRWLAILSGTFQWVEHAAFARNAVKRVSAKPKGYLADTGLACITRISPAPRPSVDIRWSARSLRLPW